MAKHKVTAKGKKKPHYETCNHRSILGSFKGGCCGNISLPCHISQGPWLTTHIQKILHKIHNVSLVLEYTYLIDLDRERFVTYPSPAIPFDCLPSDEAYLKFIEAANDE